MNKKDFQCFTVKEVKEMHRFFFEKEDKQSFDSEISFPVQSTEDIMKVMIQASLPIKRHVSYLRCKELELLSPFNMQTKRARIEDTITSPKDKNVQ